MVVVVKVVMVVVVMVFMVFMVLMEVVAVGGVSGVGCSVGGSVYGVGCGGAGDGGSVDGGGGGGGEGSGRSIFNVLHMLLIFSKRIISIVFIYYYLIITLCDGELHFIDNQAVHSNPHNYNLNIESLLIICTRYF